MREGRPELVEADLVLLVVVVVAAARARAGGGIVEALDVLGPDALLAIAVVVEQIAAAVRVLLRDDGLVPGRAALEARLDLRAGVGRLLLQSG